MLKRGRWSLAPREPDQEAGSRLRDLLRYNLRTVRAHLLKEELQLLWDSRSVTWAAKCLDGWCSKVMRSRIEPMKKLARSFRVHRELLLNWFRTRGEVSAGVAEGLNNKLKVVTRRAYGLRTLNATKIAPYHSSDEPFSRAIATASSRISPSPVFLPSMRSSSRILAFLSSLSGTTRWLAFETLVGGVVHDSLPLERRLGTRHDASRSRPRCL